MIGMTVGIDDVSYSKALLTDIVQKFLPIRPRINYNSFFRCRIRCYIAVDAKRSDHYRFNFHQLFLFRT